MLYDCRRRALMDLDASVKHRSGHELDLQSIVHLRSAGYVVDRNTGLSSVSLSPQRIDDKSKYVYVINSGETLSFNRGLFLVLPVYSSIFIIVIIA